MAAADAAKADANKTRSNQAVCYLDDKQLESRGAMIN